MSFVILCIIGIILNAISICSIKIITGSNRYKQTRNDYFKYTLGFAVGLILALFISPISIENIIVFSITGGVISEALALFFLSVRQAYRNDVIVSYYDDGSPPKVYITGDKHRNFAKVKSFCHDMNTRKKDILIILGDAGFNFYDDQRDDNLKKEISNLNITLFCLHGNKENRPQNVGTYGTRNFCGGKVLYEPKYPNIFFAIDGEIYTFDGKKYMVVGGAHSVDKLRCLEEGTPFWHDEMPDNKIKKMVEDNLANEENRIYGMLTHTCPLGYIPTEMFVSTQQNASIKRKPKKAKSKKFFKPDIDRSTEEWLGMLEKKIDYEVWFCGHYHIDKQLDKIQMMYHEIRPLHLHLMVQDNGLA